MSKDIKKTAVDWLLETDDTGVRYLALRDLVEHDEKELTQARKKAHSEGPIARVLAKMKVDGYWEQPGAGYYPKIHRDSMVGHPVSPARSLR